MSLATNISNLATRVATEIKAVRALSGDLSTLDTTAKANLVAAVNELNTAIGNVALDLGEYISANDSNLGGISNDISTITEEIGSILGSISALQDDIANIDVSGQVAALIDDTTTSTSLVWSSSKTNSAITDAVAAVVDMAPAALDTLNELAAALGDDANYASTITTALAGKANATHSHAISDVTGLQTALDGKASASALSTLTTNVGDTTTNFVTTFEAGLI